MKIILSFDKFLTEKLKPSQFREYMKLWDENPSLRDRYKEIFESYRSKPNCEVDKNAYRIFLPLIEEEKESEVESEITTLLDVNNYDVVSYISGQAKFRGAKNPSKIGQILTKLKADDLMKKFIEDPNRKQGSASKFFVCISRHPYDIAGADTDRKWNNCMTLETGENAKYLINDVKEGSLVGYLINKDDKNIQDPIANCAIKPYINVEDPIDIILVRDKKSYPGPHPDFERTVSSFLRETNGDRKGVFELNSKLYNDNRLNNKVVNVDKLSPENIKRIAKAYGIKLKDIIINTDLSIDVKTTVDLTGRELTELPLVFNRVYGSFLIQDNELETLEGSPAIVDVDFLAYNNKLKTLKGGPIKVGGEYSVSYNYLTNLDGAPEEVGSYFEVSFNKGLENIRRADVTTKIRGKFANRTGPDQSSSEVYESSQKLTNPRKNKGLQK